MKSDNINNNTTNNKANAILSIKKTKDGRNQYTVNIDGKEVTLDEDEIIDDRILKTELQNRIKQHFEFFFLSMIPPREKSKAFKKTVRDFVKNIIQEQIPDCNPLTMYQQLLQEAVNFISYRDKDFKMSKDLQEKIDEDFYIFNVRSNDKKAEIIKQIKKNMYSVFIVDLKKAFQLYFGNNRKITNDKKKKILDFLDRINEKIISYVKDNKNLTGTHLVKVSKVSFDDVGEKKMEQANIKKDNSTEPYEKKLLMNLLDSVDIEYLKPIIHRAVREHVTNCLIEFYTRKLIQINNKFKGNKEKKIINVAQDSTKINPSDVKKYDIIRIESCDATKKFGNPKGYRKIGIVVNKDEDKDKIECLLLNSHNGTGHYPNMQVNGEPIKINNKDFFLSDLPFNMQNEFGNDKLTSYISRDTYTLSNNDKNNIYSCGFLDKSNKTHIDLIKKVIAAADEGIKGGYDDEGDFEGQISYSKLKEYINDFVVSEATKEKGETNGFSNVTPLPFDKNGKITYKEYAKCIALARNEIDDLVDFINCEEDSKKHKKKKKTKNKDTQADKKEDTKQEDVKKESISAEKNNYVAKINTENANNTNSINFK